MKKISVLGAVVAMMMCSTPAKALDLGELNIANHLGVGVSVSTNGIGVEAATPITKFLDLRAGVSFFPDIKFNTTVDVDGIVSSNLPPEYAEYAGQYSREYEADVKASLGRTQGHVILNFYPFQSKLPFYIAAGAYFGGSKIVKIDGYSEQLSADMAAGIIDKTDLMIGDYQVPMSDDGHVKAALKAPNFRPYLGIGFGHAVPTHRINFGVELGVQFGKMKPWSAYGDVDLDKIAGDEDASKDIKDIMDKLTVWPVLKFTLNGRIF